MDLDIKNWVIFSGGHQSRGFNEMPRKISLELYDHFDLEAVHNKRILKSSRPTEVASRRRQNFKNSTLFENSV